jgi:hypothetical protein
MCDVLTAASPPHWMLSLAAHQHAQGLRALTGVSDLVTQRCWPSTLWCAAHISTTQTVTCAELTYSKETVPCGGSLFDVCMRHHI